MALKHVLWSNDVLVALAAKVNVATALSHGSACPSSTMESRAPSAMGLSEAAP